MTVSTSGLFARGLFLSALAVASLTAWGRWGDAGARRLVARGDEHLRAGRGKEALEAYRGVPGIWASGKSLGFRRGTALLHLGSWKEAVEELGRAVESPLSGDTSRGRATRHHNLALAHLGTARTTGGRLETALAAAREAADHARRALVLQPGLPGAAWNLELALRAVDSLEREERMGEKAASRRLIESFGLTEAGNLPLTPLRADPGTGKLLRTKKKRKGPPW
jgi:tetratricopeptide (TPR) repeat protein